MPSAAMKNLVLLSCLTAIAPGVEARAFAEVPGVEARAFAEVPVVEARAFAEVPGVDARPFAEVSGVSSTSCARPDHIKEGDAIRVRGLKSEKGRALNGKTVRVTGFIPESCRFEVLVLSSQKNVSIPAGNVWKDNGIDVVGTEWHGMRTCLCSTSCKSFGGFYGLIEESEFCQGGGDSHPHNHACADGLRGMFDQLSTSISMAKWVDGFGFDLQGPPGALEWRGTESGVKVELDGYFNQQNIPAGAALLGARDASSAWTSWTRVFTEAAEAQGQALVVITLPGHVFLLNAVVKEDQRTVVFRFYMSWIGLYDLHWFLGETDMDKGLCGGSPAEARQTLARRRLGSAEEYDRNIQLAKTARENIGEFRDVPLEDVAAGLFKPVEKLLGRWDEGLNDSSRFFQSEEEARSDPNVATLSKFLGGDLAESFVGKLVERDGGAPFSVRWMVQK